MSDIAENLNVRFGSRRRNVPPRRMRGRRGTGVLLLSGVPLGTCRVVVVSPSLVKFARRNCILVPDEEPAPIIHTFIFSAPASTSDIAENLNVRFGSRPAEMCQLQGKVDDLSTKTAHGQKWNVTTPTNRVSCHERYGSVATNRRGQLQKTQVHVLEAGAVHVRCRRRNVPAAR